MTTTTPTSHRIQPSSWLDQPHRALMWSAAAILMILPIMLMGGVDDPGALVMLGGMVVILGAGYELAMRVPAQLAYRTGMGVGVLAALMLIWINLAVGIIGSEDNPQNLIYAGVVTVALSGAILTRFRPRAMAWAMAAAAAAQAAVFTFAWIAGWQFTGPITVFFGALWLIAALLFRRAAHEG